MKWGSNVTYHQDGQVIAERDPASPSFRERKLERTAVMATFATPSEAVLAAVELCQELAEAGLPLRCGIHAGEVEIRGSDISGAVVNLAARVEQAAGDGEIYVTKTIRDMLLGTSHQFEDAGSHTLRGFEGAWLLYRIAPS